MSGKRIEINPGEWLMVADRTILVEQYESVLGDTIKLGTDLHQGMYFFTFTGRINRSTETDSVTVAIPLKEAWDLFTDVLNGFELLRKANES
jgi:hypothetical protein